MKFFGYSRIFKNFATISLRNFEKRRERMAYLCELFSALEDGIKHVSADQTSPLDVFMQGAVLGISSGRN